MKYTYDDGGREAAGFPDRGANDCVARAIAVVTGEPYGAIYERLAAGNRATPRQARGHGRTFGAHTASHGIPTGTLWFKLLMAELGFEWMSTVLPGHGPKLKLVMDELPLGRLIAQTGSHYAAVIDNTLHDTMRGDARAHVTGYWILRSKSLSGAAKVLDKVHKLINLSKENSSPHEAALAAERAFDLLAQHNLSLAELQKHGESLNGDTDRIRDSFVTDYRDLAILDLWVATAEAHYCRIIYNSPVKGDRGYVFTLVGRRTNIIVAATMAEYLCQTMLRLTADAVRENRHSGEEHGRHVRTNFMTGMVRVIQRRLSERRRHESEAAPAAPGTGSSLTIWRESERKENDSFIEAVYPRLRKATTRSSASHGSPSYNKGREAGARVSLDPQIKAGTRKVIL